MIIMVPQDAALYPTLGPQVCAFMEENLVFGPGDLLGDPLVLDDERRFLIYRMYELFPRGHARAGRRRFSRCALSLAKGRAKTELSALIAACELHPDAPVRFKGWTEGGEPIGGGVRDPYIPFIAYTEEQSDELAFGALRAILERSAIKDDFDIGLERVLRRKGDGKAVSLSAQPSARDGARTTFCVFDETHRWTLPRMKAAHQTMLNNLAKRKLAEPWAFETTTAPEPGAGSVAEDTMDFGLAVHDGLVSDASLFFFHQQASEHHQFVADDGTINEAAARAAVIEASGATAEWRDIDAIVDKLKDPKVDRQFWARVWANQLVRGGTQAFDVTIWKALANPGYKPEPGALITIGFDGAKTFDSTGIVCTEVETGFQWKAGVWERPVTLSKDKPWKVPAADVDAVMRSLFNTFDVWRLYADPPYWQEQIAIWRGVWGEERVIEWWTTRDRQMTTAIEGFRTAIADGTLSHDGDPDVLRHMGNARKRELRGVDAQGQKLYVIQKERSDSPHKMDLAMCSVLSWEARTDAIAAGATHQQHWNGEILNLGDYLREGPLPY